jgi:ATP-binding cassette subfamily B multidrug efflux pump
VTTERDKRREAVYEEDEVLGRPFDRTLAGRLVRTARPYAALIALMILILLVLTAADVAIPFLTRTAVDEHIVPELRGRPADGAGEARAEHLEGLLRLGLALAALLVLRFVLDFANVYGVQYAGQAVMHDLRMAIFSHFQKMSLRYFDRNPVGKLVTRGTSDIQVLNETFSGVLINLFKDVFLLLGLLGALLWLDWRLSLVTFVVLPALVAATVQFRRYARDAYRVVRAKVARINAFIAENIAGMAVVQVFNREDENLRRFREINDEHFRARMREVYVFAVFRPLVEIISSAAIALVVWYGGGRALAGGMSLGSLVAFIALVQMFFRPIQDLSEKYNLLQAAMASSERIFQVLDEPEEVPDPPSPAEPAESRGRVEFRDVWFAYQGEDWVLKGVSFVLEPGKSLALVGPTGAGKSTIAHLLGRYSDVTRGEVRVDGMDVRRLPKARLRRRHPLEHPAPQPRHHRRVRRPGRRDGPREHLHRPPAQPLRRGGEGARLDPLGRRAAAPGLRAGAGVRPPDPRPRRGHGQRGHGHGGQDPGGAREAAQGPHLHPHRAPTLHRPQRGPDSRPA